MIESGLILPDVTLQPGDLCLVRRPAILRTILGSCIGVTLWSARLGAGALCHGVLPNCPTILPIGFSLTDGYRFVDFSIRYLAQQFDALGAHRHELEVKVFGGADVLPVAGQRHKPTVGALNCKIALEVLEEKGFTVSASDIGGVRGRRIHFHTGTGEVLLQRLSAHGDPDMKRAMAYE